MELLVCVLSEVEKKFDHILENLERNGITGCTVIDSTGMQKMLHHDEETSVFFGAIRGVLSDSERVKSHTLLMVLDKDKIETAISAIEEITGSLENENAGIAFSIPVDFVKGVRRID